MKSKNFLRWNHFSILLCLVYPVNFFADMIDLRFNEIRCLLAAVARKRDANARVCFAPEVSERALNLLSVVQGRNGSERFLPSRNLCTSILKLMRSLIIQHLHLFQLHLRPVSAIHALTLSISTRTLFPCVALLPTPVANDSRLSPASTRYRRQVVHVHLLAPTFSCQAGCPFCFGPPLCLPLGLRTMYGLVLRLSSHIVCIIYAITICIIIAVLNLGLPIARRGGRAGLSTILLCLDIACISSLLACIKIQLDH